MKRNRSIKATAVLSTAALAMGGATIASPMLASAAPPENVNECSLVSEQLQVTSAQPDARTELFAEYGNTSGNWVGADSTYSAVLKDGTIAWLFSDTLLGTVTDGVVDVDTRGFINNSFILERDGELVRTVTGGTEEAPEAVFGPPAENSWYWLGAGYVSPNGQLQVGLNKYDKFGPGIWDWTWDQSSIATVDPSTWEVTEIAPVELDSNVQWTSWYERTEGKTYIYGVDDQGALKQAHVARVAGHDLSRIDKWEFWTGSGWSRDAADSAPILDHVANEYSVTKFRDGYLLVTHDTSEIFSNKVVAYTSCDPTGPFVNKTDLFQTPETGLWGSYGDPNIFTYNSHVHPEFSTDSELLISYNVNTFDNEHVWDDVTIYRPRFWTVTVADSENNN
ncbi:DUF4185 domain-containing protein [Tessaracoccus sp. OS52]|uniref:DUF4185 domain-containing protein n=1 Tax=Tessaracoccus sp. OS52 TaxID=2886691 RepID=UPI001D10CD25|nr:DUF4185 domain-containing protein [Tessaracoccus sp. OS52]MCC2591847.1 DUF4185 domain-containing protein [Tessaracoccus sp. OS52]